MTILRGFTIHILYHSHLCSGKAHSGLAVKHPISGHRHEWRRENAIIEEVAAGSAPEVTQTCTCRQNTAENTNPVMV